MRSFTALASALNPPSSRCTLPSYVHRPVVECSTPRLFHSLKIRMLRTLGRSVFVASLGSAKCATVNDVGAPPRDRCATRRLDLRGRDLALVMMISSTQHTLARTPRPMKHYISAKPASLTACARLSGCRYLGHISRHLKQFATAPNTSPQSTQRWLCSCPHAL